MEITLLKCCLKTKIVNVAKGAGSLKLVTASMSTYSKLLYFVLYTYPQNRKIGYVNRELENQQLPFSQRQGEECCTSWPLRHTAAIIGMGTNDLSSNEAFWA